VDGDSRMAAPAYERGTDEYDTARAMWNGRFDRYPDRVAACRSADDVADAVAYAVAAGSALSVIAGGHSYAARSVADGGILIDLSRMKKIDVDVDRKTVAIGPGVLGRELDAATQAHGLAVPTPTVSSVSVVGAALGGGGGYLTRAFGLTLDSLISAEVVSADGTVVRASDNENSDLFWALRGGGGNFGIVTEATFQLHDVGPMVLAGQIVYEFDDAARLLREYRSFMEAAPDEFQCYAFCFRAPPIEVFPEATHGKPVLDFVLLHHDPGAAAFVKPLQQLGTPVLDFVAPTPYVDAQKAFDPNLPKGMRYVSKAHDLVGLTDGVIDTMVEFVPRMAGALTAAYIDPVGRAAGRVPVNATAYAGRDVDYGFHVIAGWHDEVEDASVMGWANAFNDAMAANATGGVYVNLIGDDELDRIPSAYGRNFDRLVELKTKWDPTNLFTSNYNIAPST